jgi:hypothetical protein
VKEATMTTTERPTHRYLVTIRDTGNITNEARNVHTILTSPDHVTPRDRVDVVAIDPTAAPDLEALGVAAGAELVTWQVTGVRHSGDEVDWYVEAPAPVTDYPGDFTSRDTVPDCLVAWAEVVLPPSIYRARRYALARLPRITPDAHRGYNCVPAGGFIFHDDADPVAIMGSDDLEPDPTPPCGIVRPAPVGGAPGKA